MKPLITIITTSLNRRDLLKKTLDSVLAQGYSAIEQLVIDAASQDGTVELLTEYELKFNNKGYKFHWLSEKDSGQGEAMNKGLRMASGEFITILNSDDILKEEAVGKFMSYLILDPTIDFIYGSVGVLNEQGERLPHGYPYRLFSLKDMVRDGYQIGQPACIFKKTLLKKAGYFDETLNHVTEYDLFTRFVRSGAKYDYIDEIFQCILEHPGRKTLVGYKNSWRETKKVNFRNGGGYFSRFYLLYLKNVYFNGAFNFLKNKLPPFYSWLKKIFT
jgi:glycosyltransferase involved in cell wall biosynthesis